MLPLAQLSVLVWRPLLRRWGHQLPLTHLRRRHRRPHRRRADRRRLHRWSLRHPRPLSRQHRPPPLLAPRRQGLRLPAWRRRIPGRPPTGSPPAGRAWPWRRRAGTAPASPSPRPLGRSCRTSPPAAPPAAAAAATGGCAGRAAAVSTAESGTRNALADVQWTTPAWRLSRSKSIVGTNRAAQFEEHEIRRQTLRRPPYRASGCIES